jgi:hypothetical protein
VSGQLRQAAGDDVLDRVFVEIREHGLAERRRVQRQERADLEHLQARVRPEDVVHDEHAFAVGGADADRFTDTGCEHLRPGERARPQLVEVEVAVPELQQLRAELVLIGVEVLLDETVLLKSPEQAVNRRLREPDTFGDVAQAEPTRMLSERLQDPHGAVDRLNLLSGYCRTPFDIVEYRR